jgi:hypothetical protein
MVFLEFDGFLPHMGRRVFDDDRVRQNMLVQAGWLPFRVTSAMLGRDAAQHFHAVARAIQARSESLIRDTGVTTEGLSGRLVS